MEFNLEEMTEEELNELLKAIEDKLAQMESGEEQDEQENGEDKDSLKARLSDSLEELEKILIQL